MVRLLFPKKVDDMRARLKPYMIWDGESLTIKAEAPKEIVSLWKEYRETVHKAFEKAEAVEVA